MEISNLFLTDLTEGDRGSEVYELQYLLSFIGAYSEEIPQISIDGVFGSATADAVRAFQRSYGISETGDVTYPTWDQLYRAYLGILDSLPSGYFDSTTLPYPGSVLRAGSTGQYVEALQNYLNYIGNTYTQIPEIRVDGSYGPATENAVRAYQGIFGLTQSGIVSSQLWNSITSTYRDLYDGNQASEGQYPGYQLG